MTIIRGTIQLLLPSLLFSVFSLIVFVYLVLLDRLSDRPVLLLLSLPDGVLPLELGDLPLQFLPTRLWLLELMLKLPPHHRAQRHFRLSFISHGHLQMLGLHHIMLKSSLHHRAQRHF